MSFSIGTQYRLTLQQMALHGKNPWVRAAFTHSNETGRVKSEDTGADNMSYLTIRMDGHTGLFIFRIDQSLPGGNNVVLATLFLVV